MVGPLALDRTLGYRTTRLVRRQKQILALAKNVNNSKLYIVVLANELFLFVSPIWTLFQQIPPKTHFQRIREGSFYFIVLNMYVFRHICKVVIGVDFQDIHVYLPIFLLQVYYLPKMNGFLELNHVIAKIQMQLLIWLRMLSSLQVHLQV